VRESSVACRGLGADHECKGTFRWRFVGVGRRNRPAGFEALFVEDEREPRPGARPRQTLALGAVSIGLLAAFLARQARVANPLMPLRLFRAPNVGGANLVQALLVVGMFGMFFLGALYMQRILGYDALDVGLAYLPMTVVMGTMSFRFTGQLNLRYGPQATLVPAMVFIVGGLLLLARTPVDASYAIDLLPAMILIGLGPGSASRR
jgi:predicted MFS family arabinose efflux permease